MQDFSKGRIVQGFKTKGGSAKIIFNENGQYLLEVKKYLFGVTVKSKQLTFDNYDDAEDKLNDIKTYKTFW